MKFQHTRIEVHAFADITDYHLEVELNIEGTNEDRNPEIYETVKDNSPDCESITDTINLTVEEHEGINRKLDSNDICSNRYEGPFGHIKTGKEDNSCLNRRNKEGNELISAHSNDHVSVDAPCEGNNTSVNATEKTYGTRLNDTISLKRKCIFGESDEIKIPKVQDDVSDEELSFHQLIPHDQINGSDSRHNPILETAVNDFQLHSSENVFDSCIEGPGSNYEKCRYTEDMSVRLPCFGSQSLDFASQLSLQSQSLEHGSLSSSYSGSLDLGSHLSSQSLEFGSVNSRIYDTHTYNDTSTNVKYDDLATPDSQIRDTQIKRLQACIPSGCLTFSSQ